MVSTIIGYGHVYPTSCCPPPDWHSILWYRQPMIGRGQAALWQIPSVTSFEASKRVFMTRGDRPHLMSFVAIKNFRGHIDLEHLAALPGQIKNVPCSPSG